MLSCVLVYYPWVCQHNYSRCPVLPSCHVVVFSSRAHCGCVYIHFCDIYVGVSFNDMIPEVWAVEVWRLHGPVFRHDMLFCMEYARPTFVAEGAVGGNPSDFVVFLVHVLKYLVFIFVVFLTAGAVPVFPVNVSVGSYAVVENFHHHLRWPSPLFISHDLVFVRCFSRVFAYVSPVLLLSCIWWD